MGGMFDPVHIGHLQTARNLLDYLELDTIRLLPCGNPVHRDSLKASARHRLAMLDLALSDDSRIVTDDRECSSPEPSFAIDSLEAIRHESPSCRMFYIMGQDTFNALDSWKRWQDILALVHVVVAARPGYQPQLSAALAAELVAREVKDVPSLKQYNGGKILITRQELLDISSSMVREKILNRESIKALVPLEVAAYIQANGLYTTEVNV